MNAISLKKFNNKKRYILFFILFFAVGLALGGFGTYKTLGLKEEKKEIKKEVKEEEKVIKDEDITKNPDYTELVNRLYSYLGKDVVFYNSTGLDINNMSNEDKLRVMYKYIISNKLYESIEENPVYYGALTCMNGFNLDVIIGDNGVLSNGTKCSVIKISKDIFVNSYNSIFANDKIEVGNFNPYPTKSCILDKDVYYCGNINVNNGVNGTLEARFEIVKVIKNDKTIEIYDKGYLIDNRSSIKNPDDGHDNYYLHSTDSTAYYYELKSADNITFIHTFELNNEDNYKYVSTRVME